MPTLKSSLIKPSKSMLFFHIWNANFSVTPINSQMYMTKPKQVQKKLSENTGKTFSVIMPSFTCRGWAYLRKLLYLFKTKLVVSGMVVSEPSRPLKNWIPISNVHCPQRAKMRTGIVTKNNIKKHYQYYPFTIREGVNWKKTFSFGHCPNYLNPPPMTPIQATWSSFFGSRNSRFESQFRT